MKNISVLSVLLATMLSPVSVSAEGGDYKYAEPSGTYSIIAVDPETGEVGVAVQSNTIAVASRVRWGRGGVGAIASQASSNPMMGEVGILLLERGFTAEEARDMLVGMDDGALNRQFAIIGTDGIGAAWTSPDISDWKGHKCGTNYCAQGNTLTGPDVVLDMAAAFEAATGSLAERMLAGLEAAEAAGGDRRGTQSAGLLVMEQRAIADYGDWALDLRVDESSAPLVELRRLLEADMAQDVLGGVGDLVEAEDYPAALALIEEGLALDPQRDQAYLQMADVKLKMGDSPGALEALAKTVELNPKAFNQILRDDDFAAIHDDPTFAALGDVSAFAPLPPSSPEGL